MRLADLRKAIALNPNRVDAWAAMGECHYQLGQMKDAIVEPSRRRSRATPDARVLVVPSWGACSWTKGAAGDGARHRSERGDRARSSQSAAATGAGLADSHRLTGDIYYAQKKSQDAVVEYGRYLELAALDAIDRVEVEAKLRQIARGFK